MKHRLPDCLHELPAPHAPGARLRPPCSDYDLNQPSPPAGRVLTAAAVLVPLVDHDDGLTVLLTQRTAHLRDHPGQISFPGGRLEPEDSGPIAAALRETREETGIEPGFVRPVGCLDDYETATGYLVTPVVGLVRTGFTLLADSYEVADIFEVPLDFLLDPATCQTHAYLRGGQTRHYYVFEYGDRYIWGATAGMLVNLTRRLRGEAALPQRPRPPA